MHLLTLISAPYSFSQGWSLLEAQTWNPHEKGIYIFLEQFWRGRQTIHVFINDSEICLLHVPWLWHSVTIRSKLVNMVLPFLHWVPSIQRSYYEFYSFKCFFWPATRHLWSSSFLIARWGRYAWYHPRHLQWDLGLLKAHFSCFQYVLISSPFTQSY